MNLHALSFDKQWTLFLDRDGVINQRIMGGYVKCWEEFIFLPGVLQAMPGLSGVFGKIIVVSNQQGVGKRLMDASMVIAVHKKMILEVEKMGGRIDKVYFSPHLEAMHPPDRKPGTGMAMQAVQEFPGIRLDKSVMVGDSKTDMEFGRNIGAINILILPENEIMNFPDDLYDHHFPSLLDFSQHLKPET